MTLNGTGSSDAWQRECLIEVNDGTSKMTIHGLTENVNIEGGERSIDVINLVNLGQIPKHGGMDIFTVTFEGYPLYAGSIEAGAADGYFEMYANSPVTDEEEPLEVSLTNTLTRYRVTILWSNDSTATSASGSTAASTNSARFVIADCIAIGCPIDFTDKIHKQTLTFKGNAFDKRGSSSASSPNVKMDSGKATALVGLADYTPYSSKW